MAWIESHQELRNHPKTKRLARQLGISVAAAIGHLHLFWWWSMDYAENGNLTKYDPEDIADAAGWEGNPQAFLDAMINCGPGGAAGFIDKQGEEIFVHDWQEYIGRLLEHRESSKRRKAFYADARLCKSVRGRDGNRCRYCGKEVNWADKKGVNGGTYDHVDPNGENNIENVVVACRACSSQKGDRTLADANMNLLPVLESYSKISECDLDDNTNISESGADSVQINLSIHNQPNQPNLTKPNQTEPNRTQPHPTNLKRTRGGGGPRLSGKLSRFGTKR
jgi:5-methylcytosine-specific restriction endonuclease McrA